jgi:hypothetical protein
MCEATGLHFVIIRQVVQCFQCVSDFGIIVSYEYGVEVTCYNVSRVSVLPFGSDM